MVLFFVFLSLFLIFVLCLVFASIYLCKKTNAVEHINNVDDSCSGLPSVVHYNASKTVEKSVEDVSDTLEKFNIDSINIKNFYNSLK